MASFGHLQYFESYSKTLQRFMRKDTGVGMELTLVCLDLQQTESLCGFVVLYVQRDVLMNLM